MKMKAAGEQFRKKAGLILNESMIPAPPRKQNL